MSKFILAFRHSQTLQEFLEHQWLDSGVVKIMITATWLVKQFILAKVIQRALKLLPVLVLAWHEMVRPWEMACWEWEQHLGLSRFLLNELDFVSRWKPIHVTTMCCTYIIGKKVLKELWSTVHSHRVGGWYGHGIPWWPHQIWPMPKEATDDTGNQNFLDTWLATSNRTCKCDQHMHENALNAYT